MIVLPRPTTPLWGLSLHKEKRYAEYGIDAFWGIALFTGPDTVSVN